MGGVGKILENPKLGGHNKLGWMANSDEKVRIYPKSAYKKSLIKKVHILHILKDFISSPGAPERKLYFLVKRFIFTVLTSVRIQDLAE